MILCKIYWVLVLFSANAVYAYFNNLVQSWTEPMVFKYPYASLDYLPKTGQKAQIKGWKKNSDFKLLENVKAFCPEEDKDKTLCTLHDTNERIVGFLISIQSTTDNLYANLNKFYNNPWFKKQEINNKTYYSMEIYVANEGHIKDPGRGMPVDAIGDSFRIINQKNPKENLDVPILEKDLEAKGWFKQNCETRKGTHYLYNNTKTNCNIAQNMPIVLLVKNQELVGFSFMIPGVFEKEIPKSEFLEKVENKQFKKLFPDAPKCLKKWAKDYKMSILTITFAPQQKIKKCETKDYIKPPGVWNWMKNKLSPK